MALTTPRLLLPYPVPNDTVDVPRDLTALVNALDPKVAAYATGTTAARPTAASMAGRLYWNTTTVALEFSNGTTWYRISPTATYATGTTATKPTAASSPGGLYWNTSTSLLEFSNGTTWYSLPTYSSGTTALRPSAATVPGAIYWNTNNLAFEMSNGTAWVAVPRYLSGTTASRPTASTVPGAIYWDTTLSAIVISNGTSWVQMEDIGGPGLGGTLPTPTDGLEYYYQNAAMASARVVWHARYKSAVGWDFVGGPPMSDTGGSMHKTTTAIEVFTSSATLTVPLSGVYMLTLTVISQMVVPGYNNPKVQLLRNGAASGRIGYIAGSDNLDMGMLTIRQSISLTAGDVLTIGLLQTTVNEVIYTEGYMELSPVHF